SGGGAGEGPRRLAQRRGVGERDRRGGRRRDPRLRRGAAGWSTTAGGHGLEVLSPYLPRRARIAAHHRAASVPPLARAPRSRGSHTTSGALGGRRTRPGARGLRANGTKTETPAPQRLRRSGILRATLLRSAQDDARASARASLLLGVPVGVHLRVGGPLLS